MISIALWLLYPGGRIHRYLLDIKHRRPYSRSGCFQSGCIYRSPRPRSPTECPEVTQRISRMPYAPSGSNRKERERDMYGLNRGHRIQLNRPFVVWGKTQLNLCRLSFYAKWQAENFKSANNEQVSLQRHLLRDHRWSTCVARALYGVSWKHMST
jgi:hypothetical protein